MSDVIVFLLDRQRPTKSARIANVMRNDTASIEKPVTM